MFECYLCDKVFDDTGEYEEHFEAHYGVDTPLKSPLGLTHTCYCDNCSEQFERGWATIYDTQYCSHECANDARRKPEIKHRREQKKRVRERDGHSCVSCGSNQSEFEKKLDVHHIVPKRKFKSVYEADRMENLITLCPPCHRKWEGLYLKPDLR